MDYSFQDTSHNLELPLVLMLQLKLLGFHTSLRPASMIPGLISLVTVLVLQIIAQRNYINNN